VPVVVVVVNHPQAQQQRFALAVLAALATRPHGSPDHQASTPVAAAVAQTSVAPQAPVAPVVAVQVVPVAPVPPHQPQEAPTVPVVAEQA
jgi:hypothetical protein